MKNKGFSLVELIIVIAIMAILVGFMVPVMLIFVEKSKVSSDIQLADTVHSAVAYAITDSKVVEDPASQPFLAQMDTTSGMYISDSVFLASDSVLKESMTDYIGCDLTDLPSKLRSRHGNNSDFLLLTTNDIVVVRITETDNTAKGDTSSSSLNNDIVVGE